MHSSVTELVLCYKEQRVLPKGIIPSNLKKLIEGLSTEAEHFSSENIAEVRRQAANSPPIVSVLQTRYQGMENMDFAPWLTGLIAQHCKAT